MYPKTKNVIFIITNVVEIIGILSCLFIYSFILAFEPLNNTSIFQIVSLVVILFIFTGISYYKLANYYLIEEKKFIFSILEVGVLLISLSLILLFSFLGPLIMFISIINLAFYLILLCEVSIYFINKCRIMKSE